MRTVFCLKVVVVLLLAVGAGRNGLAGIGGRQMRIAIKKENIEQLFATRCFPEGRKNLLYKFLTSYRQPRNPTLAKNL